MTPNAQIHNPDNARWAQPELGPAMPESLTRRFTAKNKVGVLLLIVALGFFLRVRGLDAVGFSEDEVNKVEAARAYLRGNFGVNLEHPMLMKWLVTASLGGADFWNRHEGLTHPISEETAVRFPNVVFGALTAIVIFAFAQQLFGFPVGLISALIWSISPLSIAINRLAKEDTLLVFFTWLAYYFYLRAKSLGASGTPRQGKLYALSGASFGLMLASKYFPHYLGLNFLYYHLLGRNEENQPLRKRDFALIFGTCGLVFLLVNPIILLPGTLKYMLHYVREGTMTHHGYLMMGHFYYGDPAHIRGGMPIYFYPLFLAIKTPLPILAGFILGLVEVFRRRREAGSFFVILMFLFWTIPFSLLSAKWLRYMLSWMPTVYIIAALGVVKVFAWASALVGPRTHRRWAPALAAAVALVFLAEPAWVSMRSTPYYTLYLNPLGLGRTGYYFPHDEVNDMGLREAIKQICEKAPKEATVGGEAEPVFAYYFHKFGRDDLHYFDLSDQVKRVEAPPSAYLVVQDGRKYFENISFIQRVESYQVPIQTVEIGGAAAGRVYRDEQFAELRVAR